MTTDLAIYEPAAAPAPITDPASVDSWVLVVSDVIKIANVICDTPFVPDGLRGSGPAVAAAILAGREMGLGIMTSLANIDVIKGKPTQKALLMRAMIQGKGHKWQDVDVTDARVVIRACRKGEAEWTQVTFTADQAKRAGIDLGKYPADKLYARATSRLARRKFADVIMGMPYSAEDLEDGGDTEAADVGTLTEAESNGHAPAAKPAPRTAQRRQRAAADRPTTAAPAAPTALTTGPATATAAPSGDSPALPPLPGEEEAAATDLATHVDHKLKQVGRCVYCDDCGQRLYQGKVWSAKDREEIRAAVRQKAAAEAPPEPDETDYDTPGTVTTPQLGAIWTILKNVFKFTAEEKDQARAVAAHIIGRAITSTRDMSKNEAGAILDTLANWQATAKERGEEPRELLIAYMAASDAGAGGDA